MNIDKWREPAVVRVLALVAIGIGIILLVAFYIRFAQDESVFAVFFWLEISVAIIFGVAILRVLWNLGTWLARNSPKPDTNTNTPKDGAFVAQSPEKE